MPILTKEALKLLGSQANVIATWQDGAPDARSLVRAHRLGQWREITSKVYAVGPGDVTGQQYLWAAALHFGPDSMLSGQAALVEHGWTGTRDGKIDVLVPRTANPRMAPNWLNVHRTTIMPVRAKSGVPRALPAAATADAVAWARTTREAEFLVVSVLQQGICEANDLERVLEDRPTTPRRAVIEAIIKEFRDGVTTMGELDFARLCREYGIREPDRQVWRKGARGERRRLDCFWDAEGVVVEIDGIGHLGFAQVMDDQERQNQVVKDGVLFLRVTNFVLRYEPEIFIGQLQDALRLRAA